MFRLIQTMFARSTAKSTAPNRRLTRGRVESLESRCMLSVTLISSDILHFGKSEFNSGVIFNNANDTRGVLGVPQFDSENDAGRPSESPPPTPLPPATPVPPAPLPPAPLPPAPQQSLPPPPLPEAPKTQDPPPPPLEDEKSPPSGEGGMIDFGDPMGTGETDIPPPDVSGERETRAVLQMLTKLQYSLEIRGSVSMLDDSSAEGEFDGFLGNLANQTGERYDDADREGGAVAIAIQEVVAERDADAEWNDTLESLHDVSVEMDSTSGRYQAFEVSTLEDGAIPIAAHNVIHTDVNVTSDADIVDGAQATDTATESVSPAEEASPEPAGSPGVPLSLVTPPVADESMQMTWTSVVALVTLGIALQFCREWKFERLRSHAAFAWQHLVESPGWLRRRTKAERQQAAVE